jgi:tRNA(Ile)-lysidine synthase
MPRSHPPALLKLAERTLREECRLERGQRVLIAVSGGGESTALLHVMSRLRERLRFQLFAHGVDHGLRPEAAGELDLAEQLAEGCEVEFSRSRVHVERGGNLQARARSARYRELGAAAKRVGAELIATAHHADDRAETVLLRLLRGAGPRGLGVLPARSGELIRPLLRARRTDIVGHLRRHGLVYAQDASNRDARFLRVRVRNELVPLLEALSPQIVRHLNALADQMGALTTTSTTQSGRVPLSRAHFDQIERALVFGLKRARIRLPGGQHVRIDPDSGLPVLEEGPG